MSQYIIGINLCLSYENKVFIKTKYKFTSAGDQVNIIPKLFAIVK